MSVIGWRSMVYQSISVSMLMSSCLIRYSSIQCKYEYNYVEERIVLGLKEEWANVSNMRSLIFVGVVIFAQIQYTGKLIYVVLLLVAFLILL